ncbi:hypothetical protein FY534_14250 (plasmid) [Alicyclobacillus sp. TC]|uniref:RNA polymerase sigma factor (Sigma-70 family) n=1 Tax=Alicyclobacillus tolerans TaxID=90970 RepID=A0ABT9M084_9BACL|nr:MULTISPECIES: hypothetical protein [Alicyclobacillus]MDP9729938.1 RNA polymerase sigma factor (sigma-70 family) [Alicyclobacillus tengchongensis]QRF24920.1 hypothetical protein FY534_14195 [Alicyclobacillus sp. TC]QRF24931.1 hypothetical protein FY534_14250 [Alicyclobacillus sp. TC]
MNLKKQFEPKQEVAWCLKVIRNHAHNMRKQYARWSKDELTLNELTMTGEEREESFPSEAASYELSMTEWEIFFNETLTNTEKCIVKKIYWEGSSQRETAKSCVLSQAEVSRVNYRILQKLKEELKQYEM